MKHWFITMWPDCKEFLKLSALIYGICWVMMTAVMVLGHGFPLWTALWGVGTVLSLCATLSSLGFLASTLP